MGDGKAKLDGAPFEQVGGFFHPTERPLPGGGIYTSGGLTLRDWFAGQALVGLAREISGDITVHRRNGMVSDAYELADAMLAERSKP